MEMVTKMEESEGREEREVICLGSSGLHMLPYLNVFISFVVLTMASYFQHLYQKAVVVTGEPEVIITKQPPPARSCRIARSFELVEDLLMAAFFPGCCLVSQQGNIQRDESPTMAKW